jgi:RNA recognition motif-containing protein
VVSPYHVAQVQVNEDILAKSFHHFPSFAKCRIIKDYKKCKAKGDYGFVSFTDHVEGAKALRAMNGKYIGNRPCQLKKSTHSVRNAPADSKKRSAMLANPMERITTKRMR